MTADCPACPRPARAPWLALASGLLAALLPKCPLCLAGYLSLFGVTVGAAAAATAVLRPLGLALAALGLGWLALRWRRRARPQAEQM
jgi:hypothetical protein